MRETNLRGQPVAIWILALAMVAVILGLAVTRTQAQSTLTFREWAIPISTNCPFGVLPVSRDTIYFTESICNDTVGRIGKLNTNTNTITEWSGSALVSPQQGLIAMGGSILFTDGGANTISMLNPKTNGLKKWAVPFSGPLNLRAVGTKIFFTELNANKIGMLDLLTGTLTEWVIPGGPGGPLGIVVAGDGSRVWFSHLSAPQLGVLDPDDNSFKQWTLPSSVSGHHVQHVAVSEEDNVFFVDDFTGSVGRLDAETNVITVWATPAPNAGPVDLQVHELEERDSEALAPFRVDFTESGVNKIGRLLTSLQTGTNTTVLPITTVVAPAVTTVSSSTSILTAVSTVVTPTITNVPGVISGGFEEWLIPTANSDVYAIAKLRGHGVAFSEANGNKIGTLR